MEEVEARCGSEALGLMERLYAATGAGLALGGGGAAVDGARLEPGLSCGRDSRADRTGTPGPRLGAARAARI